METALLKALLFVFVGIVLFTDLPSVIGKFFSEEGDIIHLEESPKTQPSAKQDKIAKIASTMKNSCLPKLICELNASPEKEKLTHKARSLLQLIKDTSMSMTAEVSSRYHFAAHMGQLISGVDGTGCHNFYPGCPLPTIKVLNLINKPSLY